MVVVDLVGFVEAFGLAGLLADGEVETTLVSPFAEPTATDPETRLELLRRARRAGVAHLPHHLVEAIEPADSAAEPDPGTGWCAASEGTGQPWPGRPVDRLRQHRDRQSARPFGRRPGGPTGRGPPRP